MAVRRLLDTNVALYLLGGKLAGPIGQGEHFVSVITEMELLSYPQITPIEEKKIRAFLEDVTPVGLNPQVRNAAVQIRRQYRLKLPDANICTTAQVMNAELLSNDAELAKVSGLMVTAVPLK